MPAITLYGPSRCPKHKEIDGRKWVVHNFSAGKIVRSTNSPAIILQSPHTRPANPLKNSRHTPSKSPRNHLPAPSHMLCQAYKHTFDLPTTDGHAPDTLQQYPSNLYCFRFRGVR